MIVYLPILDAGEERGKLRPMALHRVLAPCGLDVHVASPGLCWPGLILPKRVEIEREQLLRRIAHRTNCARYCGSRLRTSAGAWALPHAPVLFALEDESPRTW